MKKSNLLLFLLLLLFSVQVMAQKDNNIQFAPISRPSFQVDYVYPTADKPQSKLWFMNGYWWALLPRSSGPSLWQRTTEGWKEYTEVNEALSGVPGRVDVWADHQKITAVGVADHSLTVFQLIAHYYSSQLRWKTRILAVLFPSSNQYPIETATIVQDGKNIWWVAAVADSKVYIWHSFKIGRKWSSPYILAEGTDKDDICVIASLKDGVGVIWSNQVRDAVIMRTHKDGQPADSWEEEVIIEMGNKTADDHLNTALAPDGTLWVATKNSVDLIGKPQFVLRVRSPEGQWFNRPYEILEKGKQPRRPIVIVTEDNSAVYEGHKCNDSSVPFSNRIIFARVDTSLSSILDDAQVIISPDSTLKAYVDNVTGPKNPFPLAGSLILLASDQEGRVYEAELWKLIFKP